MRRSIALCVGACLVAAATLQAQNVDEIVTKNIEARGGLAKIKAVKTMKLTGRVTIGPGTEAPMTIEVARPNKMRLDVTVQGMTLTQAFDGKQGWQINPFGGGSKTAELMSADEQKEAEDQADFDGPLVDWKAKGHKVELVGKEKVEGTDAYKLRVTLKNGNVRYIFLDADSYLDIRGEEKRTVRGTEMETEQTIGDYKDTQGLLIPYSFETGAKGHPEKQKIMIDKIEIDAPVGNDRFTIPAKKEEPAEKKPAQK
jgi:outer membrane lipoprotein-sorting protein